MNVAADLERVAGIATAHAGLRALLLFGSRARGDAGATSDWDFGYLADPSFDPVTLLVELTRVLQTDRIDLVDLGVASGLLRFRAARDGMALFGDADVVQRFRIEAASFWCDAEPVLRAAYDAVLERI